jgi:hypothetical protein
MKYICLGYLESGKSKTCQRANGTPCWTSVLPTTTIAEERTLGGEGAAAASIRGDRELEEQKSCRDRKANAGPSRQPQPGVAAAA